MRIKQLNDGEIVIENPGTIYLEEGSARLSFLLPAAQYSVRATDERGVQRFFPVRYGQAVLTGYNKPITLRLELLQTEGEQVTAREIGVVKIRRLTDALRERYVLDFAFSEETDRAKLTAITEAYSALKADHEATKVRLTVAEEKINRLIQAINNPY